MKEKLRSLTFLIPAYNDQDTVADVVDEALVIGKIAAETFDILVINDKSPDDTGTILQQLEKKYKELRVIHHTINKGYGGTIKELYEKGKGMWLFTIPGDYQIGAKELLKLLPSKNDADMIIGWRVIRHDPEGRLQQSKIYNTLLRWFFGLKLHDVNSVRLMKSSIMRSVRLTSSSAFVDAELALRTKKEGFKIIEVPIEHRRRSGGEQTAGGGKLRTILPTIWEMVKYYFSG